MEHDDLGDVDYDAGRVGVENLYSAWTRSGAAISSTKDPEALYLKICEVLVEEGLGRMAWVGAPEPGGQEIKPVARAGSDDGFLETCRHSALEIPTGLGPTGVAARTGAPDVVDDIRREPRMSPWQAEATKREFFACAAFPISSHGQVTAILTLYGDEPAFFDARLVRMLGLFADNVSLAIESIEKEERSLQAQESLRRSEVYYRTLIENSQDIIMVLDADGKMTYVSPSAQGLLAYGRWELRNRGFADAFHPDDGPRIRGFLRELSGRVGAIARTEGRFRHKDGTFVDLDLLGRSFQDESGDMVVVSARDLTERKVVEDAQKKDRDFILAVLDTTDALILVFDPSGHIILFNSTAEEATGYLVDEVRGRTPEFLIPPEEMPRFSDTFKGLVQEKADSHRKFECHILTRQGASRLISWSNMLVGAAGSSGAFVIYTGIDITEQRHAEAAVKESEERYRRIFESTGTAMCLIRTDGTIDFLNKEFERMTGHPAREVQGVKRFTDFLAKEDVMGFVRHQGDTRRGTRKTPVHFDCDVMDRSGGRVSVHANIGLVPGRDFSVVSLIDVTRERAYERELAERAERLRHFLTVASHELRHPITIVKGYANTLNAFMDEMPPDHIREILKDINASTDRLTRYVEELMDVSMVEEGRLTIEARETDASDLLRMAVEDMKAIGADNTFSIYVAPEAARITVDAEKFLQVLIILVENAVKFSPKGSPVEIAIGRNGPWIEGVVLDRGRGIGEDDRLLVFDRFYQVEDTMHHSTPGMGLGLYIAREIIAAHNGTIACEPRQGGGTIFRFRVPIASEEASPEAAGGRGTP